MSYESDDELMENLAPTNLEFWSLEIPPGKLVQAQIKDVHGMVELVHITGCALGESPGKGPHVVKVVPYDLNGKPQHEVALGTLFSGRTDQFAVDFGISSTTAFRHSGNSTVYLTGYRTRSYQRLEDESEDEDFESDESEDDDDSEDEEAPNAVPLPGAVANGIKIGSNKKVSAAAAAADDDESEDESDSEGESDEDEDADEGESESDEDDEDEEQQQQQGNKYDKLLGAKTFGPATAQAAADDGSSSDEDDDESEEGESSDDEDNPLDVDSDDVVAAVEYEGADGAPAAMETGSEDEESEEAEDEDEDEDEDESDQGEEESADEGEEEAESEDEQPAAAAAARFTPGKRPAQPLTPQPQMQQLKRQKADVPQSAPAKPTQAKTAAAAAGGGSEQQFLQSLVTELRKGGPRTVGELSNKVKKPADVAGKYKAFLTKHPDTFVVDGDKVSLKA